jgi:predicted dehydrogenase
VAGIAAAAAPEQGAAAPMAAGPKLKLGLIGCGGRGKWLADLFLKHGGYELFAVADYFQDRVDETGEKFGVPVSRRFTGLSAYKRLLDAKPDAVALIAPPYFRPEQAAAAVDAGVHVYLAKPVAVDAPGCRSIAASGARAAEKKLCFLVDFQTRTDPFYREALRRVHAGAIGEFVFGEASYQSGRLSIQTPPGTPEARLRTGLRQALRASHHDRTFTRSMR